MMKHICSNCWNIKTTEFEEITIPETYFKKCDVCGYSGTMHSHVVSDQDAIKIGAEISARNRAKIQAAHDTMVDMGAVCKPESYVELDDTKSVDVENTVIAFGGNVKGVQVDGGWQVRCPLVVFTNPDDPDLTGDYFDASTDFDMEFPGKSTAYFQHGQDSHFKKRRLDPVTLDRDEFGVWAEGILRESDEYEKLLIELGKAGKLGMSSGVPGHLVETEPKGKANHITYWPLGKDASYTHTPAEPKTRLIIPLKTLITGETPQELSGALADPASNIVEPLSKEANEMTDDEVKTLIGTVAADAAKAAVEEYKRAEPATANAGAAPAVVKDAGDQPFKNLGEFFMAVKNVETQRYEDPRLRSVKAPAGMSEGVPADGGYLIPPAVAGGILTNMINAGDILNRVSMTPVSGNSMTWNMVDETSRASTRWGGVLGYWLAEAGTKTASAPKFKQLELKLKKVAALAYATDELLADATALQSWLTTNVPKELAFQVENAFINGDGVGKPLGILNAPGLLSFARVDASKVQYEDVVKMYARRFGPGPFVWLINRGVMVSLMQMAGTYQYLWLPPGAAQDSPNARLLGYPVIEVDYCAALGTIGDIILADLNMYQAISKGGVEAASSIHVKFTTDETAFRFVYRTDGAPVMSSVFTPFKGDTQAPFVVLTTAS
jgi:HK97 family phage major capsid protein